MTKFLNKFDEKVFRHCLKHYDISTLGDGSTAESCDKLLRSRGNKDIFELTPYINSNSEFCQKEFPSTTDIIPSIILYAISAKEKLYKSNTGIDLSKLKIPDIIHSITHFISLTEQSPAGEVKARTVEQLLLGNSFIQHYAAKLDNSKTPDLSPEKALSKSEQLWKNFINSDGQSFANLYFKTSFSDDNVKFSNYTFKEKPDAMEFALSTQSLLLACSLALIADERIKKHTGNYIRDIKLEDTPYISAALLHHSNKDIKAAIDLSMGKKPISPELIKTNIHDIICELKARIEEKIKDKVTLNNYTKLVKRRPVNYIEIRNNER